MGGLWWVLWVAYAPLRGKDLGSLLLLPSKVYARGSPSSPSASQALSLGPNIWVLFWYVTVFCLFVCLFVFNLTTEVVIFRLRGWCRLGEFLLPPFTRQECQDLLSPYCAMHVCADWTSVYTLIRQSFGGTESGAMLIPMEKRKKNLPEAQSRIEPTTPHHSGQRAQHYRLSCSGPLTGPK